MENFAPIMKYIISAVMCLAQIIAPYGSMLVHGGISSVSDKWEATDKYTSSYAVSVEKDPNRDFVILNLTDIQIENKTLFSERGEFTERLVRSLVQQVNPDLITLTGDNASCAVGYFEWIKILDSFGIPWAPVMGNHDGYNGSEFCESWIAYELMNKSEYCLFKAGPEGMGYGNYVVNITENGKVIHSLIMMDTHSEAEDTPNGVINYSADGVIGEDHLWENQLAWYEWCIKGITETEGRVVESTAMMHIPVYQFSVIQDTMTKDGKLLPEYESLGTGILGEGVCAPEGDNGFFALAKELGSTTMMVFGHDHKNNMCITYDGIRLNYGQKSGHSSYFSDVTMGGSVITVNSEGHTAMSHIDYTEK